MGNGNCDSIDREIRTQIRGGAMGWCGVMFTTHNTILKQILAPNWGSEASPLTYVSHRDFGNVSRKNTWSRWSRMGA